jgi:translation elongation factor P/translation initiation factor 5A
MMAYKIPKQKTKVGDLIVHKNNLYKVIKITKDKQGKILKLKPL